MPNPTDGDLRVDQVLTNMAISWMQDAKDFVADQVFPVIGSEVQGDRYVVYDRADLMRAEMAKRAPGAPSAGGGYRVDNTPTFYCDVWALHKDIEDQRRANQRDPIDLDTGATKYLAQQALLKKDIEWTGKFLAPKVWTQDYEGDSDTDFTQWSSGGSTPVEDLTAARYAMKRLTGQWPNVLVLGADVWGILQNHSDILERLTITQSKIAKPDILASLLEVDRVLIASGVQATTQEGDASPAFDFINGTSALLAHAAPSPSLDEPSAGYTFAWTGLVGAGTQGQRIKSFRMEENGADRKEIEMAFDQKVVAPDLGAYFNKCVDPGEFVVD